MATDRDVKGSNEAAVRAFYGALTGGEGEALFALCAEDVQWDVNELPTSAQKAGVPWLLPANGKRELINGPAAAAARELDTSQFRFQLKQVVAGQGTAFSFYETSIACKRTGKSFRAEGVNMFEFDDEGKIKTFKHFVDTGAHVWAWTPDHQKEAAWAAMGAGPDSSGGSRPANNTGPPAAGQGGSSSSE